MVKLNELRDNPGAHTISKRVGRGIGSGKGKQAGRGTKGQGARKSGNVRPGFEGGQNPLYRRLPQRGFNNANFTTEYVVVNIGTLQAMVDDGRLNPANPITIDSIIAAGVTKKAKDGLKILATGELKAKLTITAAHASEAARTKIEQAGGKLEILAKREYLGKYLPKAERTEGNQFRPQSGKQAAK